MFIVKCSIWIGSGKRTVKIQVKDLGVAAID